MSLGLGRRMEKVTEPSCRVQENPVGKAEAKETGRALFVSGISWKNKGRIDPACDGAA